MSLDLFVSPSLPAEDRLPLAFDPPEDGIASRLRRMFLPLPTRDRTDASIGSPIETSRDRVAEPRRPVGEVNTLLL